MQNLFNFFENNKIIFVFLHYDKSWNVIVRISVPGSRYHTPGLIGHRFDSQ
jgi:hypothetical protein